MRSFFDVKLWKSMLLRGCRQDGRHKLLLLLLMMRMMMHVMLHHACGIVDDDAGNAGR